MNRLLVALALASCSPSAPPMPPPDPSPEAQAILDELDRIEAGFWDHRQLLDLVRARSVIGVVPANARKEAAGCPNS